MLKQKVNDKKQVLTRKSDFIGLAFSDRFLLKLKK